jgi:hypothetical protein
MKKLLRFLVIPSLVLPVLIPSKVSAFGGPQPTYGFQDRERFRSQQQMSTDRGGRLDLDPEQSYLSRFESLRNRFDNNDPSTPPQVTPPAAPGGGENAPIDGGLSLLLAAGLGLGVKKAVARRKASKQDNNETIG